MDWDGIFWSWQPSLVAATLVILALEYRAWRDRRTARAVLQRLDRIADALDREMLQRLDRIADALEQEME